MLLCFASSFSFYFIRLFYPLLSAEIAGIILVGFQADALVIYSGWPFIELHVFVYNLAMASVLVTDTGTIFCYSYTFLGFEAELLFSLPKFTSCDIFCCYPTTFFFNFS